MIRFSVFSVLPILACGVGYEQDAVTEDIEIGVTEQALDAARTRMIQEASQAMTGSWWTYNETNWPTATTYGTYSYVSSDLGAWNLLLDNNYNGGVRGWWVSCRRNSTTYNYNTTDAPCLFTAYGDLNTASLYDCQGICSSGIQHKGGQCKPFTNLVAYRSGIYQNPGYAFKKLPDDLTIAASSPTVRKKSLRIRCHSDLETQIPISVRIVFLNAYMTAAVK